MGVRSEQPGQPSGTETAVPLGTEDPEGADRSGADASPIHGRQCGPRPTSAQDPLPPDAPRAGTRKPVRMCVRCQVTTETPVVVAVVHQNSGPGFAVYACQACAAHCPPQPDVLAALPPSRRARSSER